jgi:SAM-dependent methyltransferase
MSAQASADQRMAPNLAPLRTAVISVDLADPLMAFVEKVARFVDWREFSMVPWRRSERSRMQYYRSLFTSRVSTSNRFLTTSPVQDYFLKRLSARVGVVGARLFRLMCLNELVDEATLAPVLTGRELAEFERDGVLIRHENDVTFAVSLIPYDDHYYVAESRHIMDAPQAYGVRPAHISPQTITQIDAYRRLLRHGQRRRMLEMGCGIGAVALELFDVASRREGVDIASRSIAFARINGLVRGDENAEFYESDLFASVTGTYDVIVFNPWQPSQEHIGLIERFIAELPTYLAAQGTALLWIGSTWNGRDAVLDVIERALILAGLQSTYYVVSSYRERVGVGRIGCLAIQHGTAATTKAGRAVRMSTNGFPYRAWLLRRGYAQCASRRAH